MFLHLKDVAIIFTVSGFLGLATATAVELYAGFSVTVFVKQYTGFTIRKYGIETFYRINEVDYQTLFRPFPPRYSTLSLGTDDERYENRKRWYKEDRERGVIPDDAKAAYEAGQPVTITLKRDVP